MLDEPTELPEGAEIELVPVAGLDDLDDEGRAELHAAIDEGLAEGDEQGVDAADLIAELRSRR
ncbi:MAG: hypothetical protein IT372_33405 [Polyangiaceae bacterium]|nr:hypothetical protein [Polyangiaceae bacterium]